MFCSRCGKQVVEGNRFCQACGQEVGAAVTVATTGSALSQPMGRGEGVSAPIPYAGFWERFAAYAIDGLILSVPFGIAVLILISMLGGIGVILHRSPEVDPHNAAVLMAPFFLIFLSGIFFFVALQWLYFAGMESSERQATFGKSVMSLRVANYEGKRISFGHATGRFFAKIVSGMVPLAIGYIMAAFTAKKQALHDLIAGTLVLKG